MTPEAIRRELVQRGWVRPEQLEALGPLAPGPLARALVERGWVSNAQLASLAGRSSDETARFDQVLDPDALPGAGPRPGFNNDETYCPPDAGAAPPPAFNNHETYCPPDAGAAPPPAFNNDETYCPPDAGAAPRGPAFNNDETYCPPDAGAAPPPGFNNDETYCPDAGAAPRPSFNNDETYCPPDVEVAPPPAPPGLDATVWSEEPAGAPPPGFNDDATYCPPDRQGPAHAGPGLDATVWSEGAPLPVPAKVDQDATYLPPEPGRPPPDDATAWGEPAPPGPAATFDQEQTYLPPEASAPAGRPPGFQDDATYCPDTTPGGSQAGPEATVWQDGASADPDVTRLAPDVSFPQPEQDATTWDDHPSRGGLEPSAPARDPARFVDHYELLEELGRGGMGTVHRARDTQTGREVAIKRILPHVPSRTLKERFGREGELAARLSHPGILRVHAAGATAGGGGYLVCELVIGARNFLEGVEGLPLEERVARLADAAEALGAAHAEGVVHRDVKPDNLLIGSDGRVRVADFGLAAAADMERLTQTGVPIGTPSYMAPEQVGGEREMGPPVDVWALGVILYELLTRARPFAGETTLGLFVEIRDAEPLLPRRHDPQVSRPLEAICLKALSREPQDRYPDARAMAADLRAALAGEPIQALPPQPWKRWARKAPWVLIPLLSLGLVLGAVIMSREEVATPTPVRVALSVQAPERLTKRDRVVLRGRVEVNSEAPIEVWVEGQESSSRTTARAGSFRLTAALIPGRNTLRLFASAGGVESEPVEVEVESQAGLPGWYLRLESRPRLPAGLTPRAQDGEYEWSKDGSVLVYVPPGSFEIGSTGEGFVNPASASDTMRDWILPPPGKATLTRGYFIGKYEVRWSEFDRYLQDTKSPPLPTTLDWRATPTDVPGQTGTLRLRRPFRAQPDHPVFGISRARAREYCAWAGLRLPTELEWERAARGVGGLTYPWGNERTLSRANMLGDDPFAFVAPVDALPEGASPVGCLNMGGNVAEWVEDDYAHWEGELTDHLHRGDHHQGGMVNRGGDWANDAHMSCWTSIRHRVMPGDTIRTVGFRVALSEPAE